MYNCNDAELAKEHRKSSRHPVCLRTPAELVRLYIYITLHSAFGIMYRLQQQGLWLIVHV